MSHSNKSQLHIDTVIRYPSCVVEAQDAIVTNFRGLECAVLTFFLNLIDFCCGLTSKSGESGGTVTPLNGSIDVTLSIAVAFRNLHPPIHDVRSYI